MFGIGEKIVYPMYGAGTIEDIEERDVDGNVEAYYVISIPNGNMTIKLSTKKSEVMGIRRISEGDAVIKVMEEIASKPVITPDNWNQRYKENMQKIKTGKLIEVAEVVRNLYLREKERGLSGVEKKMFNNARQIIISEIVFSNNLEKEEAEELLIKSLLNL